jgi:hypothetical protein
VSDFNDERFITEARALVPALCDEILRLRALLEKK